VHMGQLDKGLSGLTTATELAPTNYWHWFRRAQTYARLQQWDKTVADYTRAIELKEDFDGYNSFHFRAVAYVKLNRPELAIADLRQAVAKGYKNLEGIKSDDSFAPLRNREDYKELLAEIDAKAQGVLRQAITENEKLAAANPNDAEPRDRLAHSHHTLAGMLAQKQPQEAIKEFRAAIAGWEKLAADLPDKPDFPTKLH